jgi:hypothetical protein
MFSAQQASCRLVGLHLSFAALNLSGDGWKKIIPFFNFIVGPLGPRNKLQVDLYFIFYGARVHAPVRGKGSGGGRADTHVPDIGIVRALSAFVKRTRNSLQERHTLLSYEPRKLKKDL